MAEGKKGGGEETCRTGDPGQEQRDEPTAGWEPLLPWSC